MWMILCWVSLITENTNSYTVAESQSPLRYLLGQSFVCNSVSGNHAGSGYEASQKLKTDGYTSTVKGAALKLLHTASSYNVISIHYSYCSSG